MRMASTGGSGNPGRRLPTRATHDDVAGQPNAKRPHTNAQKSNNKPSNLDSRSNSDDPTDVHDMPHSPHSDDVKDNMDGDGVPAAKLRCKFCDKTFGVPSTLRVHLRVHTGERPFRCDFEGCDKAFSQRGNLTKHRRIHTGELPFECRQCRRRFRQKGTLKRHQERCKPYRGTGVDETSASPAHIKTVDQSPSSALLAGSNLTNPALLHLSNSLPNTTTLPSSQPALGLSQMMLPVTTSSVGGPLHSGVMAAMPNMMNPSAGPLMFNPYANPLMMNPMMQMQQLQQFQQLQALLQGRTQESS